jgi:hypothetical protein
MYIVLMNTQAVETQDRQIRRLLFWNRFWLALACLYTLFLGYNFLFERLTYDVLRLHLSWSKSDTVKNKSTLLFSLNQGGPFAVTHLVKQRNAQDPNAAVATLPKPLLVYRYKSHVEMTTDELAKLVWIAEGGKKVSPPSPGQPVTALHYRPLEVPTRATTAN